MPRQSSNKKRLLALDVLQTVPRDLRQHAPVLPRGEERCGFRGRRCGYSRKCRKRPASASPNWRGGSANQSTQPACQDRLVAQDYLTKTARTTTSGASGCVSPTGLAATPRCPVPAEGVLPEALSAIRRLLRTLHINLSELIRHLPGNNVAFARVPLAEIVTRRARTSVARYAQKDIAHVRHCPHLRQLCRPAAPLPATRCRLPPTRPASRSR